MKNRVKKHLPNAITCANLFSGCIGIVLAFKGELIAASYAIFLSAIFDFFDGLASRVLKSFSGIGKDLDSLADMVSFGVLPAVIMYQLLLDAHQIDNISQYLNFIAFLIPVFSALRLAKFNVDTRQAEHFIGLPTPANAILIASFPLILDHHNRYFTGPLQNPYFLSVLIIIMCTLLVVEVPMMSLKFKNRDFNKNIFRYLLLLFSAILILFFKFAAVPVVIVFYIILSFIQFKFSNEDILGHPQKEG
ncbi:CDP-diacylglycerol--serine O-phosphatidyltransferase [Mucilaginibacter sp. BJC16-A38]|uniref:CDP-diacylglycerol--serine O-phosphatidyltransferase n=1 Tax=Mucilaginibacter phenanthrenivorans TaxID=1234842 RepID=UPI002157EED6|nr:CDP-diacylglycerol--serine O-phosphatidyltransferase [Mucilaginibacter phenanthrenivorans]MCR8559848.1 CDP-diacylglycerol--serine O-phosphatidyltransferase [Mucilaginibacter phenanthrenivorans]MDP9080541.1 CDP-diacylglycerol--serine O-phosphatidyltransferase [Bacteroidota bacterium]